MNSLPVIVLILFQLFQGTADERRDSLVWPSSPDRPRIKFLGTISSEQISSNGDGLLANVLNFIFGGEKSFHWLIQPVGIAVSHEGEVYITDPGVNGVHRLETDGKNHTTVVETKFGKFRSPVGVVCGGDGRVYISDSDGGNIIIADRDLDAQRIISDHLMRPTGINIINNRLYVVDTKKHAVVIFDLSGNYLTEFGRRGEDNGEFNYPIQVAGKDCVYVVDALNYRIQMFDADGRFVETFGHQGNALGRFASPKDLALDSEGNIYVTDALMDNIQIFNPAGQLLLAVGQRGSHDGEFMMPNGIAIDHQDRIYVVDTMNRRVQLFQYLK